MVQATWSPVETKLHINILELRAIRMALQHWTPPLQRCLIRMQSDSVTTVAYINHQGEARVIQPDNFMGRNSRQFKSQKWTTGSRPPQPPLLLNVTILASRLNHFLFVSRTKDPLALASDALIIPWSHFRLIYAFPPSENSALSAHKVEAD